MNELQGLDGSMNWPSFAEYTAQEQQFMDAHVPLLEQALPQTLLFRDLYMPVEQAQAVSTLSRFMFGISTIERSADISVLTPKPTDDEVDCPAFGFNPREGYVFNRTWLVNLIRNSRLANITPTVQVVGIRMNLDYFAQISGVEEARHKYFFKKKPGYRVFNKIQRPNESASNIKYDAQDHEFDALSVKLEYTRLYFPQYYPAYKAHYDEVVLYRRGPLKIRFKRGS